MATSGRYQSRLFSFFSQQSLRLKDKAGQAWRQVKLASVWGTQIALYPIYALFQTGRLLGRQMGQAAQQSFPRLRAFTQQILKPSEQITEPLAFSDTPIQNLLAKRQGEGLAPLIQGFASLLTNRGLVLVTAENEILDVLTGKQQTQLQQQMTWEMAHYWRHRKIQPPQDQTHLQGWTQTFLPLPKERANLLPPVRAFRHLMAWIQLSPVAIAINLFQESHLTVLPAAPNPSPEDLPLRSAQLPGSKLNQLVHDLLGNPRGIYEAAPPSEPSPLLTWVRHQANGLAKFSKSLGSLFQNFNIVLYDPSPKSEPSGSPPVSQTVSQKVSQKLPHKPWLKIEDFFGGKFLSATSSGQIVESGAKGIQISGEEGAIAPFAFANELLIQSQSSSAIAQPVRAEGAIASRHPQEIASTLLEAEVTEVSYETHPLEQLLKWLDLGMLWIEQKLEQVWKWVHRP